MQNIYQHHRQNFNHNNSDDSEENNGLYKWHVIGEDLRQIADQFHQQMMRDRPSYWAEERFWMTWVSSISLILFTLAWIYTFQD